VRNKEDDGEELADPLRSAHICMRVLPAAHQFRELHQAQQLEEAEDADNTKHAWNAKEARDPRRRHHHLEQRDDRDGRPNVDPKPHLAVLPRNLASISNEDTVFVDEADGKLRRDVDAEVHVDEQVEPPPRCEWNGGNIQAHAYGDRHQRVEEDHHEDLIPQHPRRLAGVVDPHHVVHQRLLHRPRLVLIDQHPLLDPIKQLLA